jgi:hypothetical protein
VTKPRTQRSSRDIAQATDQEDVLLRLNELIDQVNFLGRNLSFQSNFDGQIVENLTFVAGETKTIPHSLGKIPKFRIILRQEGNGVLSDIPSGWSTTSIKIINNGAVTVTATIMIVRE